VLWKCQLAANAMEVTIISGLTLNLLHGAAAVVDHTDTVCMSNSSPNVYILSAALWPVRTCCLCFSDSMLIM